MKTITLKSGQEIEVYKYWKVLEELPEGWRIDKTAGSPLNGYEFATNGKSVFNGQERALFRIDKKCMRVVNTTNNIIKPTVKNEEPIKKPLQIIDKNYRRTIHNLARKKFEENILKEIRFDLMVCELEGWDKFEYIKELSNLIQSFINKHQNTNRYEQETKQMSMEF